MRLTLRLPTCACVRVVLHVTGIIIARYFRHKRWWLRAHVSLQSAGSIGTVSAATVAAANTKGHFAHVHSVIGIFIAVFTGEQRRPVDCHVG